MQALIQVGTISAAMRAKRVLESHGVRAYVRRTSNANKNGCGYSLLVTAYSPDLLMLLEGAGIKILGVRGRGSL